MNVEGRLKVVIAGSFQFKPQIDLAREEFEDNGALVLAPDKGPLWLPTNTLRFYPLESERYKPLKVVEDEFLGQIRRAHLLYVVAVDGHIGDTVSMEIGYAFANGKAIYLSHQVGDLWGFGFKVKSPTQVVKDFIRPEPVVKTSWIYLPLRSSTDFLISDLKAS